MANERRGYLRGLSDRSIKLILEGVNEDRIGCRLSRPETRALQRLISKGYLDDRRNTLTRNEREGVFICHSSGDREFARRVVHDIAIKGYKVWFDEREMRPGESFYEKIQYAIRTSAWFLFILSPNSVGSKWCNRELNNAMEEELERNRPYVIPLLYKRCNTPGLLKEKVSANCQGGMYRKGLGQILDVFSGTGGLLVLKQARMT